MVSCIKLVLLTVLSRYSDPQDSELEKLEHYLRSLVDSKFDDIRPELGEKYQLFQKLPPDQ